MLTSPSGELAAREKLDRVAQVERTQVAAGHLDRVVDGVAEDLLAQSRQLPRHRRRHGEVVVLLRPEPAESVAEMDAAPPFGRRRVLAATVKGRSEIDDDRA